MKIAIITLHRVFNYGSILQAYATQKIFEKKGHTPIIIDYITEQRTIKRLLTAPTFNNYKGLKLLCYKIMRAFSLLLKEISFGFFIKKHLNLSSKYISANDLEHNPPDADIYVTGSDQTWNSKYNEGVDRGFYLDFIPPDKKRIAFVSSFGATKLNIEEIKTIKQYLSRYSAISVREDSAKEILESIGINNAVCLIDPTLQIDKKEWEELANKRLVKEPYLILMLLYSEDNGATEIAKRIATKKKLKLVKLSWDLIKKPPVDKLMTHRSPADFLSLFKYAEFVVTNSFHGTAFSINFEKQFVTIPRNEFNSRIESLLRLTRLTDRLVSTYRDASVQVEKPINYNPIRKILEQERKKAESFIDNNCN